jgi:predicted DNA-binding transcriptional regulator YafY
MRRIERLINLIAALLEAGRPMTADDIRTRIQGYEQESLEAFRRAFERDKEALRGMGIPLEVVPVDAWTDQADGYIIPKDKYYLPDIDFEPDELAALRIAADAVLGAGDEAGAGLMKLGADEAPSHVGGGRVAWSADVETEREALEKIYSALLERHVVSFDYETAGGEAGRRDVSPYGLVQRRGHWYVVGQDAGAGDVRTFRMSRVKPPVDVKTSSSYDIPEGFNAADHVVREGWEAGQESTSARVRFEPTLAWWVEQNLHGFDATKTESGSIEVELPVSNPDAFVSWLLEFGDTVAIIEPVALRDLLIERISPYLEGAS